MTCRTPPVNCELEATRDFLDRYLQFSAKAQLLSRKDVFFFILFFCYFAFIRDADAVVVVATDSTKRRVTMIFVVIPKRMTALAHAN